VRRRATLEAQIAALQAEVDDEAAAIERDRLAERARVENLTDVRKKLAARRGSQGDETRTPDRPRKRNGAEQSS